jgi:hypothetical protein
MGMIAVTGCTQAGPETIPVPVFLGHETVLLDGDLVSIRADSAVAGGSRAARDFADCLIAGYALSRGYAFARHVSTTLSEQGGVWRANAVYTISPAIPAGQRTIDAGAKVAACGENGIPTG